MKRLLALAGLACLTALVASPASTQELSRGPITIIVPYNPSSGPDFFARLIAPKMSERLGQPVVIENRPGAAGVAGMQRMVSQPADGHTLMMGDTSVLILAPYLVKDLPYKPMEVARPIALVGTQPYLLATSTAANDFQSMQDVIDAAKANPGGVSYGSPGFGSNHHIIMETFAYMAGVRLKHVPYSGGAELSAALLAGEVDIGFSSLGSLKANLEAGAVKLIGASTPQRFPMLPDVPAISEVLPGFDFTSDPGVITASGVPDAVVDQISSSIKFALDDPEVQKGFRNLSVEPIYTDAKGYEANLVANAERFAKAVGVAGVEPK